MRRLIYLFLAVVFIQFSTGCMKPLTKKSSSVPSKASLVQKDEKRVVIDTFKVTVADSARWLEDLDSLYVRNWVLAQNKATRKFLDDDTAAWKKIYNRLVGMRSGDEFGNIGVKGKKDSDKKVGNEK